MEIDGRAAVVTGGASGLGLATAQMLAGAGAKVALLDIDAARAAEAAGLAIKKSYPIVHVGVYDHLAGINKIIQLPGA